MRFPSKFRYALIANPKLSGGYIFFNGKNEPILANIKLGLC